MAGGLVGLPLAGGVMGTPVGLGARLERAPCWNLRWSADLGCLRVRGDKQRTTTEIQGF